MNLSKRWVLSLGLLISFGQAAWACLTQQDMEKVIKEIAWQSDHIGAARGMRAEWDRKQRDLQQRYDARTEHLTDQQKNLEAVDNTLTGLQLAVEESRNLLKFIAENEAYRIEIAAQLRPDNFTEDNPIQQVIERVAQLNLPTPQGEQLNKTLTGLAVLEKHEKDYVRSSLNLLLAALTADEARASGILYNQVILQLNRVRARNEVHQQRIKSSIQKLEGVIAPLKKELDDANVKLAEFDDGIGKRTAIYNAQVAIRDGGNRCRSFTRETRFR